MIKTFKNPCITLRGPNVFKGLLMKHLIVNTLRGLDKKNEVHTYMKNKYRVLTLEWGKKNSFSVPVL